MNLWEILFALLLTNAQKGKKKPCIWSNKIAYQEVLLSLWRVVEIYFDVYKHAWHVMSMKKDNLKDVWPIEEKKPKGERDRYQR